MPGSQPDNSGGCMLALYPPRKLARSLAVPDGLPADEIHLTVVYTGDAADVDRKTLKAAARALAVRPPIRASLSGHARFTGGDTDVIVALADSPALEDLRRDAMGQLAARDVDVPRDHGYTPHVTIQYIDRDTPDPVGRLAATPVTFSGISVVHGKKRTDYPFKADPGLHALASEAFAAGYALTGAPVTSRARTASAAAASLACEQAHDPGILEATLDLGHLEGTWAVVYDRREKLLKKHLRDVLAAWDDCVKPLDARELVRAFRSAAYLPSESVSPDVKFWRDTGIAATLAWLRAILHGDGYPALVAALEDAIRSGMAEGEADALALAASRQGKTGFRIADAFAAAYERLDGDPSISQQAHAAAAAMADAAAGDVGRRLASLADGGSEDDMAAGITDVMNAGQAPERGTDWALWAGIGLGAKALYSRVADALGGLVQVDWLTAGDAKVCVICQGYEDNGPYSPDDVPGYPHPGCRCSTQSRTRFPLSFLAPFLP